MSTLPTHKKSPEELARLRENLGIPAEFAEPEEQTPPQPPSAQAPEPVPHLDVSSQPAHGPHEPKPVRSLKRSEREPVAVPHPEPAPSSKLPVHRHSPTELTDLRRREAISSLKEGGFELPKSASKPLLALAYVLSIGGAASPTLLRGLASLTESYTLGLVMSEGYHLLVAGSLAALPVAGYIALKRTQSRHHAAFVAIIAFFALVFAVLHYFPQLRHGT